MTLNFFKTVTAVALIVGLAGVSSAQSVVLIGGDVRNGNLNDLSNPTATNGAGASIAADTQPNGSRASLSIAAAGASVSIPGFTATRSATLTGGNSFFGFEADNSTGLGDDVGGPDRAFVFNAGAVDLDSDEFNTGDGTLLAGTVFTLSYQLGSGDAGDSVTSQPFLTVGSAGLSGVQRTVSGDAVTTFTETFTLTSEVNDLVQLAFINSSTGPDLVDAGAIDNIVLSVVAVTAPVPEPSSLALLVLFGAAVTLRRRR